MFQKGFSDWSFTPSAVKGTEFLPDDAFKLLESSIKEETTALMIGVTANEGSLFDGFNEHARPGDNWADFLETRFPGLGEEVAELYPWHSSVKSGQVSSQILSDAVMTCPSLTLAKLWSTTRSTYFYYFNQDVTAPVFNMMAMAWDENAGPLGVAHSTEIPYIFGVNGVLGFVINEEQKQTRRLMSQAWADFSKTGSPASKHLEWPRYVEQEGYYVEFGQGDSKVKQGLGKSYCTFWFENPLSGF